MTSLLKNIITLINESVHELAQWIEQTYEIDANEIISKWEEISRNSGAGTAKTGKAQHVSGDLDPTLCQHTFLVGNNAGMQCGVKPKDGPLCSSHKPKSHASSNEKTVDIVDGALNPIYCNFEVGEGKQCGVKPKAGGLCSIHRNGAPKIKTVPLVDGVMDPVFCNRKLSETTQCGVKPKAGNYCSSHREVVSPPNSGAERPREPIPTSSRTRCPPGIGRSSREAGLSSGLGTTQSKDRRRKNITPEFVPTDDSDSEQEKEPVSRPEKKKRTRQTKKVPESASSSSSNDN